VLFSNNSPTNDYGWAQLPSSKKSRKSFHKRKTDKLVKTLVARVGKTGMNPRFAGGGWI